MDRLTAMETFVSVIEAGSFSGGARRLKVGQPAVSKSVAQLEERLGVRLLLRSTRGLTPTEAGQQFYERAKRAIEEADEAELAARGSGTSLSGRLRVCAAVTFARLHIVPKMKAFLAMHPDLNVDVMLDDRNIDLLEEGVDVALRMGVLGDSSMTARKIGQSRRVVVATPAYLAAHGVPKSPADLAGHQAIVYEQGGGGSAWSFRRGASEAAVVVSGRMRVTAAEGVRAAVLADLGVAVASEWMFAPELGSGAVKVVLKEWTLPPVDLWAVFPTGRMASAKARAFVAFVEDALGLSTGAGATGARRS
jgi:DNA-binding transcriptional LysR family regulator